MQQKFHTRLKKRLKLNAKKNKEKDNANEQ